MNGHFVRCGFLLLLLLLLQVPSDLRSFGTIGQVLVTCEGSLGTIRCSKPRQHVVVVQGVDI